MRKTSHSYKVFSVYLVVGLMPLAVFRQVRGFEFINYDDPIYVTANQHVQAGLSGDGIRWAFTTRYGANWHPLTWLSHMVDCELFGTEPGRHHLVNLFFHIINTLLLFAVFKQMTGGLWASGFVASLFALHPLHVESVVWISERKDLLSMFFWLLTMIAYVRYVRAHSIKWYLPALLFLALGLMSKPMLVTLPFVLLLLDYWPLGRFKNDRRVLSRLVFEKVPFFIISIIFSVTTLVIEGRRAGSSLDLISLKTRIANTGIAYMTYIVKMIWPRGLAILYPYPRDGFSIWQGVFAGLLLVTISFFLIRLASKHRYLAVGWLWFLGTLVPVIGLVQVGPQVWADRYTYIPLTGLFVIIGWGMPELLSKWKYRKILLGTSAIAIILALSVCSRFQTGHWRNSITLYRQAIKVTKNNYIIHNNLGSALQSEGNAEEAADHFYQALQINPNDAKLYNNLGIALASLGRLDEAIACYTEALELKANHAKTHYNLGQALHLQGRLEESTSHYYQALEIKPNDVTTHNSLGDALALQGRRNEAIGHYRQVVQINPYHVDAHYNLGVALQSQGKVDESIRHFRRAVQIKPDDAEAHYDLGSILQSQGKVEEAISHYRKVVEIRPDWPVGLNSLAWLLATEADSGDVDEAIELAERAAELTSRGDAYILDTLAAAYAASGRYDEAIETAEAALELALASENEELSNHIRSRLELYRRVKP